MDCRSTSKEEPATFCFTVQPCCWQQQVTSTRLICPNMKSGVKPNARVSFVWFHLQRQVGKLVRNLPMHVKYYTSSNTAHCYNIVGIISSIPLYSVLLLKHSSGTNKGQCYPKTCLNTFKMQLLVKTLNILGSSQTPIFIWKPSPPYRHMPLVRALVKEQTI